MKALNLAAPLLTFLTLSLQTEAAPTTNADKPLSTVNTQNSLADLDQALLELDETLAEKAKNGDLPVTNEQFLSTTGYITEPATNTNEPSSTTGHITEPATSPTPACNTFGKCFLRENDDGSYSLSSPRGYFRTFRDPDKNRVEGEMLKGDLTFNLKLDKIYWNTSKWSANSNISVYDKNSRKGITIVIHKPLNKYGVVPDTMDFTLYVSGEDRHIFKDVFTTDLEHTLKINWSHPIDSLSGTATEPPTPGTSTPSTMPVSTTAPISNTVELILDGNTIASFDVDFTFNTYELSVSGMDLTYRFDINGLGHGTEETIDEKPER